MSRRIQQPVAVQAQIAVNLRGAFHAKLSRLVALVKEAKTLSDGLDEVNEQAQRQLGVHDLLRLPNGTLVRAVDLGEAGGFCDEAAGLTNSCVSPWLTNVRAGRRQTSMSQLWLKEVEAWLARTPEMRAQEDQERRVQALEKDLERKRRMAADEVARAKLRRMIAERDGIPESQVVL